MQARRLTPSVSVLGAIDWDNRLFDSLIPLPDGTSYNSYLVRGSDATALIDTVEPGLAHELMAQLDAAPPVDYVVSLHAEQDHSGTIPAVLELYPDAPVLCSEKAKAMLGSHLHVPEERIRVVADGEELSLGDRTLRFLMTPWAHWPETMSAWLVEEAVLFPCDLFGSHLATGTLFADQDERTPEAAKRYYAEIMMPFAKPLGKSLRKIRELAPKIVAPSHGPIHREPAAILDAYEEWMTGPPRNRAVVAFVSMHGSTRVLVDRLVGGLIDRGVGVDRFDLTVTDLGKLAMALADAGTIVFGTPTVLNGPHPFAVQAAYLTNALKPKASWLGLVGSFGWKGRSADVLRETCAGLSAEWLDPVLCSGRPDAEVLAEVDALADTIADRHAAAGLQASVPIRA